MCCTDFRDCRKFAAQSGAGRARLLLSWLSCWEDQLETTIGLAWPDAFLGIFISHTFLIYKIALTLRAKSCVWTLVMWTNSCFVKCMYSRWDKMRSWSMRPLRIMFLMGLKIPRKFQVCSLKRMRITCKIFMDDGVNDRVALRGWFSIISALKPRGPGQTGDSR